MTIKDAMLCKRIGGTAVLVLLTGGMVLQNLFFAGGNYRPMQPVGAVLSQSAPAEDISGIPEPADAQKVVQLSFVGNCIIGSMLGSSAYGTFNELLDSAGPGYFLEKVEPILAEDDWTICALGSVLSDGDYTPVEKDMDALSWYRAPADGAEVLATGSVEVVSVATDHTWDYGEDGYNDTIANLESRGLLWGNDDTPVYLEDGNIRVGLYLCTLRDEETDIPRILTWIETAKEDCDFVVVYPHGHLGGEPTAETVLTTYQTMIDTGADVVLASHDTSIAEPYTYGEGVILPSLGSFLSGDTRFPEKDTGIFRLKLLCTDDAIDTWEWEWIPVVAYEEPWQPKLP